jgi:flagellar hook assembly protein FlgD
VTGSTEAEKVKGQGLKGEGMELEASPNPFNPQTTITYIVQRTSNIVKLHIYNTKGILVKTLVDKAMAAGKHGVVWNAADVPSGAYIARLTVGGQALTKKIMLLK